MVVFVGGLSARIEGEEMKIKAPGFVGGDRTSLDLPGPAAELLLERVSAVGKPSVLVLMNGSALARELGGRAPAGDRRGLVSGRARAATPSRGLLAGDYSPAGRLPVTFYKSADQLPGFKRLRDGRPHLSLFHRRGALSRSAMASATRASPMARPALSAALDQGGRQAPTVSVDVTNAGEMDGDEVVQLYVSHPGTTGAAIRSLQGFQRVHLAKGATQTVTFQLADRALSVVAADGRAAHRAGQRWNCGWAAASRSRAGRDCAGGGREARLLGDGQQGAAEQRPPGRPAGMRPAGRSSIRHRFVDGEAGRQAHPVRPVAVEQHHGGAEAGRIVQRARIEGAGESSVP